MTRVGLLVLASALAGCLSPGVSDTSRTWELPRSEHAGPPVKVFLPPELRTPRIVAADTSWNPVSRDFDRWGTPLGEAMARRISGHLLTGLPIRKATVEFRNLRVNAAGHYELEAAYRVTTRSFEGGPDLEMEGVVKRTLGGDSGKGREGVEEAVLAYAEAARTVADQIRSDYLRKANGEVAKPVPAVTVPGK